MRRWLLERSTHLLGASQMTRKAKWWPTEAGLSPIVTTELCSVFVCCHWCQFGTDLWYVTCSLWMNCFFADFRVDIQVQLSSTPKHAVLLIVSISFDKWRSLSAAVVLEWLSRWRTTCSFFWFVVPLDRPLWFSVKEIQQSIRCLFRRWPANKPYIIMITGSSIYCVGGTVRIQSPWWLPIWKPPSSESGSIVIM